MVFIMITAWSALALAAVVLIVFANWATKHLGVRLSEEDNQLVGKHFDFAKLAAWMGGVAAIIWSYIGIHAPAGDAQVLLWIIGALMVWVGGAICWSHLKTPIALFRQREIEAGNLSPSPEPYSDWY